MLKETLAVAAATLLLVGCSTQPDTAAQPAADDTHKLGEPAELGDGVTVTVEPQAGVKIPKDCHIAEYCGLTVTPLRVTVHNGGDKPYDATDLHVTTVTSGGKDGRVVLADKYGPNGATVQPGKDRSWLEATTPTHDPDTQVTVNSSIGDTVFTGSL